MPSTRATGDRIEELLGVLLAGPGRETAEELVRQLMGLYGDGLARIVALVRAHDPALVDRLADDGLLSGLLVLHDLHPLDEAGRIRRALEQLGGGAEYLGTGEDGVVRVRIKGCRSGMGAVEAAVRDAAPETTAVVAAAGAPLVQIGMGPPPDWRPEGRAS